MDKILSNIITEFLNTITSFLKQALSNRGYPVWNSDIPPGLGVFCKILQVQQTRLVNLMLCGNVDTEHAHLCLHSFMEFIYFE